ncbi:hypothetical protein [Roseateles sp. BYS96W]|uniref:Uncharacterized protein n=1 Tax=Pelomonas nitida TaxID=3299027 RepID=A0ABW7G9F1_9BURK
MTQSASLLALAAAAALLMTASLPAEAGRLRQTSVTGPQGKTATRTVARDHGDVQSGVTGPNGKTASRVVDRSPGQTTATVTGPNGQSVTRTSTRSTTSPQP